VVRSRKDPKNWVFPKGHIEPGESPQAAAGRELREEAGVDGVLVGPLGFLEFVSDKEPVRVEYFLMRFAREVPPEERREKRWGSFEETLRRIPFEDARELLRNARRIVEDQGDLPGS